MQYVLTRTALMLCIELLVYRTWFRILSIRSPRLLVGIMLAYFFSDTFIRELGVLPVLRIPVFWFAAYLLLPIALSSGPFARRASRALLVFLIITASELFAATFYSLITDGGAYPLVLDASTIGPVVATYLASMLVTAILLEALVAFCSWLDHDPSASVGLPVLAFMLSIPVTFAFVYTNTYVANSMDTLLLVVMAVYAFVSLGLSVALMALAQQDARSRRLLVRHRAGRRQLATLKTQLDASARRTDAMRRLRHDLANQVDVVRELVASGHAEEAKAHLAQLRTRAEGLEGGA